jgi:large subunit ribosomal protein L13
MKTVFAKPATVRGDWFIVDASDKTLGRLASQIAHRLKGKHKADYSPHVDMGDHIVVVNAQKIRVTGRKLTDKIYYHHTGHIGGIKSIALEKLLNEHPERAIEFAVKGMLPKNPLGRRMFKKLHVFAGGDHPHKAQQPKPLEIPLPGSDSADSLRYRPPQDRHRARLPQGRHGQDHGKRPLAR